MKFIKLSLLILFYNLFVYLQLLGESKELALHEVDPTMTDRSCCECMSQHRNRISGQMSISMQEWPPEQPIHMARKETLELGTDNHDIQGQENGKK